jgi:hypothetical protein
MLHVQMAGNLGYRWAQTLATKARRKQCLDKVVAFFAPY